MQNQSVPSFFSILWLTLFLCVIGWGGIIILIWTTVPFLWARWLFYFLIMLGISGAFLPLTFAINRRFPSVPPPDARVILRQAIWVGVYGSTLVWFQMGRMLTTWAAFFLAVGLILVETMLRLLERSRWKPRDPKNE